MIEIAQRLCSACIILNGVKAQILVIGEGIDNRSSICSELTFENLSAGFIYRIVHIRFVISGRIIRKESSEIPFDTSHRKHPAQTNRTTLLIHFDTGSVLQLDWETHSS